MSGPIRTLLGPTRSRLQDCLKRAKLVFSAPIDEANLEEEETATDDIFQRITTNVSLLERCNDNWVTLLRELKGEEKTIEEKEYSWATEGDDGLVELLLDSKEMASCLQACLAKVLRLQERAK